ncbi:MAG: FAD-binding oxidoreductase, partial [Azospirillaceae bacterium]
MAPSALRNRGGQPVDSAAIDALAQSVAGEVIDPAHRLYDEARRTWNALIDRRPGVIMRCRGTADVVKAVDFARQHDILVAVRGGGHNVAGRALCDDGLVIDLSAMRAVHVDPAAGTARVQGGATLADMDRETHLHGLAVPAGVVSKTGIGGLALGGGVGWLVRKFGPTCDNIVSMELVTADGRVLTVDADSHPDLFWGLRGGGDNFGVVTSFLFKAHPVST